MAEITAQQVKELRNSTGAGMMDAKKALVESNGDVEAAVEILRKKGLAKASKRAGRDTSEGMVHSYIHAGGRVGVLIEINCETDFVARTDDFRNLAHDLALHIAAASPLYVSEDDVPGDVLAKEKEIYTEAAKAEDKPDDIAEKIAEGKVANYFKETCLLDQAFIRNPEQTVGEILSAAVAKLGENIQVRRFSRFEIGA